LALLAAFVACLLLIPLKMAAPAPRDNVVAANANNGGGDVNAAVIGSDAAAPFALAAGAGCSPVPVVVVVVVAVVAALVVAGVVLLLVLLVMLLLVPDSQPQSWNTSMNLEIVLCLWVLWNGKKLLSSMQSSTQLTTRIITRFLRVSVLRVFLSSTLSIRLLRPMRMNLVLKEPNPDTGRINIRA
jgi:hypothetical protein